MKLLDLLYLQCEQLYAASEVLSSMLNDCEVGSNDFQAIEIAMKDIIAERKEKQVFIKAIDEALQSCNQYRQSASAVAFAQMREHYTKMFITQEYPLASKYLPKLQALGSRAGCRSCANILLQALEKHLNREVVDDFSND